MIAHRTASSNFRNRSAFEGDQSTSLTTGGPHVSIPNTAIFRSVGDGPAPAQLRDESQGATRPGPPVRVVVPAILPRKVTAHSEADQSACEGGKGLPISVRRTNRESYVLPSIVSNLRINTESTEAGGL